MAVAVAVRNERLVYRLCYRGDKWREGTGLRDTPTNRERLGRKAASMSDEMAEGRFEYLRWFPDGVRAAKYRPAIDETLTEAMTVSDYATLVWQPRNQPPLVRSSLARSNMKHLRCHVLPTFGSRPLDTLTPTDLEDFRAMLTRSTSAGGKGLAMKTARNIVDGTFRAMVRDARLIDYQTAYGTTQPLAVDPFAALRWKREALAVPDPFTEDERDVLLAYMWERRRPYHGFVYTLFHTGMRMSEAIGLRWDDVDFRRGQLTVQRSRTHGEDNAPKTRGAQRTITLQADVIAVLRAIRPLHTAPGAFVFVSPANHPLDRDRVVEKHWHPAFRVTGIRPRKLYAARHSFISAALTRGVNLKWLADYCGTSVQMIERNYGRWMAGDDDQLALLRSLANPAIAAG